MEGMEKTNQVIIIHVLGGLEGTDIVWLDVHALFSFYLGSKPSPFPSIDFNNLSC